MPTTEFIGDDKSALDYIRKRGYASYSSIKNVRDCVVPSYSDEKWFMFGKEHHSRALENKKLETLSAVEEVQLAAMLKIFAAHVVVKRLLAKSQNEIDFGPAHVLAKYKSKSPLVVPSIYGVPVYGRIDILNKPDNVCDVKTTKLTTMKQFVAAMDFLQAAIYLAATGCKNFYYIGQCKQPPYNIMVFNVLQYPERLKLAQNELKRLLKYIKSQL